MLDRYLLRYFLAVVDQGNFSRAASYCNVSQPTLSIGIAKLERTLGHALFVRSNQRVELTEAGIRFLAHARRIEREFSLAVQSVAATTDLPSLRLGVLASIPGALISSCLAGSAPRDDCRFELLFGTERELAGQLAKGRIDVALTLVDPETGGQFERPLITEGYALALPEHHRLAGRQEILPEQLASEIMIVRRHCEALSATSRFFTERGIRPHFALRSTNDERVLQMVAAGIGITVMPQCYSHNGVVRPRLAGFRLQRTLGWIAAPQRDHLLASPALAMQAIEDGLAAHGDGALMPAG